MGAIIQIHFDGPIATEHNVTLRTLSRTLDHMQAAINRAHLDVKYGQVWKHAQLKTEDYSQTDFLLGRPRDGGFIMDMASEIGSPIVRRIKQAVDAVLQAPVEEGLEEATRIRQQLQNRREQIDTNIILPRSYADFMNQPDPQMVRPYGDRSINKEIDQVLALIRRDEFAGSTFELGFAGDDIQTQNYLFDRATAVRFHNIVSKRALGEPLFCEGTLRSLDRGNQFAGRKGKFRNSVTGRDVNLYIAKGEDFDALGQYLRDEAPLMKILACPMIEYGAFDPKGGDLLFVRLETE